MKDSLTLGRIPLGSCADVRLKYKSTIGGARLGKLLQDMDHFAAVVLYKHILNPLQGDHHHHGHAVITARMDHLHIKERILADRDVVLVGHVTWVGTSRAEVGVRMEQEVEVGDENRRHVCEARYFAQLLIFPSFFFHLLIINQLYLK